MKFNKWGVLGVSAFALVAVAGGAVIARTLHNASEGASDLRTSVAGAVFNPAFVGSLNLTADQRSQIRDIVRSNRASFIPLLADAHTTGADLRDAAEAGDSSSDLKTLAAKQADADVAVLAAAIQTQAKVADVLTPDQRATAAKAIDARIAAVRGHVEAGDGPVAAALAKLGGKLNLTADQKAQAHQIIATNRSTSAPATLQLLDKLKTTEDEIATGSYDVSSAQSDAAQAAAPLATVVLTAATTRAQLLALLTPDQRTQLKQIMSQAQGRHAFWRRHAAG